MANVPKPLQYAVLTVGLTIAAAQHAIAVSGPVHGLQMGLSALLHQIIATVAAL